MLGHTKTIMVLLGGWVFLGDTISMQQLMGMAVAVLGMVLYGIATRWALQWIWKMCKGLHCQGV